MLSAVTLTVGRSKLGLNLPIEKILHKKRCNPVALLADMVMEKDSKGEWVLQGRDRLMAIARLMDHHKPKPKPQEIRAETDRTITIIRQSYEPSSSSELEDNPAT